MNYKSFQKRIGINIKIYKKLEWNCNMSKINKIKSPQNRDDWIACSSVFVFLYE